MAGPVPNTEGDFGSRLKQLRHGEISINDFLEGINFEFWLRIFCYKYDLTIFNGLYGPEDFKQDVRRKVLEFVHTLEPGNTPNEKAFFGWLKVVMHNAHQDALREHNKPQDHGWLRSDEPSDLVDVRAPGVNYDGMYFLSRLSKFVATYPVAQQRAVELWLADYSYREIEEILYGEGFEFSHVTVGNWVNAILKAFKESLDPQTPRQPPQKQPRARPES